MRRSIHLITTGGTIAMSGPAAEPVLTGAGLIATLGPDVVDINVEEFANLPSVHLSPDQGLALARRAVAVAGSGRPVVITMGTDLMEQVALLCDALYGGAPPIVFTGAMRPASAPGADGPANLRDAIAVASSRGADSMGVLVCFGGEVHAARFARKVDSYGPAAFASPVTGPLGYVREGRLWTWASPRRAAPFEVAHLDARVEIISFGLGADGAFWHERLNELDGLVAVLPGVGHVSPRGLEFLNAAAERLPVVACTVPARGSLLTGTYGFLGAEGDVRATGVVCAAALGPVGARIKLIAALGAGMRGEELRQAFVEDDL